MTQQPSKLQWGELEDEDSEEDLTFLLPPKQVIGPDKNGIKKVIEYKIKEDGTKVKITTNIQVRKIVVNKRVVERRSWAKFGDALPLNKDAGDRGVVGDKLTMVSTEEIVLERPRAPGMPCSSSFRVFGLLCFFLFSHYLKFIGGEKTALRVF